jgi:hypothetical protein
MTSTASTAPVTIDKEGMIRAAGVNADNTSRPKASETLRQSRLTVDRALA